MILALFGGLIVGLCDGPTVRAQSPDVTGASKVTPPTEEDGQQKADANSSTSKSSIPVRIIQDPEEAKAAKDRERRADQHDINDLKAQEVAADAAKENVVLARSQIPWNVAQVISTIAAALATSIAAWAAAGAAKSADASVVVAREMGRDQARAYVQAEKAFVVSGGPSGYFILMYALNCGSTPCRWFGYRCQSVVGEKLSEIEFSRDEFKIKPLMRWNGLANGSDQSF